MKKNSKMLPADLIKKNCQRKFFRQEENDMRRKLRTTEIKEEKQKWKISGYI